MEKAALLTGCAALMLTVASARAIDGGVNIGKNYTSLNVGSGAHSPGLFLNGHWMRSDDNSSLAGIGLGYNLAAGSLTLSPEARVIYVNPRHATAFGAGARYALNRTFGLYGAYFRAPGAFSHNIASYEAVQGGVSFMPVSLLSIQAGYQYLTLNGRHGYKDSVLADGPYIGAALRF